MNTNDANIAAPIESVLLREAVVLAIRSFSTRFLLRSVSPTQREIGEEIVDIGGKIRYRFRSGVWTFIAHLRRTKDEIEVRFDEVRVGSRSIPLRPGFRKFVFPVDFTHEEYGRFGPSG